MVALETALGGITTIRGERGRGMLFFVQLQEEKKKAIISRISGSRNFETCCWPGEELRHKAQGANGTINPLSIASFSFFFHK